jgi:hypothetical protein
MERGDLLDHVFVDHVDGTFFCLEDVFQRVLRLRGATRETNDDNGGIMIDHLSITEWSQIRALPICGNGRYKSNRSRNNPRDHNTVVINWILLSIHILVCAVMYPLRVIRIQFDNLVLFPLIINCALSNFPIRSFSLS